MSKRTSLLSTVLAAIVTTTLAGAALVWAAGAGTSGEAPKARSTEVATLDGKDVQARADAMRERMAETRARIDALRGMHVQTAAPTPKPHPRPQTKPEPKPPHPPLALDPECLRNPICSKHSQ